MRLTLPTAALLALALPAAAQEAAEPPTPASVVAAAPASDWKPIDPADLLVMDLAPDAAGKPRRVIIQLVPKPFSEGWVENIRALAKAHWWDGTSVYRVVDNWVAQWGDADETKPLPEGMRVVPESDYVVDDFYGNDGGPGDVEAYELEARTSRDPYADTSMMWGGFPVAGSQGAAWPIHCYGHVGVARDIESTGTGSELYAVIGHAPRQLDRNIAVIGRVIEGIEQLSTLPRGPAGTNGVYEDAALRVPIISVRLGNEVAEFPQPRFEYLDGDSFYRYARVRANRQDSFYKVPAGGIDLCNVQVPIRRVPSE